MASASELATRGVAVGNTIVTIDAESEIQQMTRRSFATGAIAAFAGGSALAWLATRSTIGGIPWPLRSVLQFNEGVAQSLFNSNRLAPEFPVQQAVEPRVNGQVGLHSATDADSWTVQVIGKADQRVPLAAIKALPAYEMTTELKCVEGWSSVVRWKGVRLADFLAKHGSPSSYVGLATPHDAVNSNGTDDRYYVGLDRPSALHPQTLLCYEMNGLPLTEGHGAPLRLVSTVKYGYKCIKRIGVIELSEHRPADYWAERGYDWYAGH
jgi:DMSO/TMAO reductase YedYZ molybdopterin-dependent catalytic subunit